MRSSELPWCQVPRTTFLLGSDVFPDEQPMVEVTLSSFEIGRTPATNAEYGAFMSAGGYDDESLWTEVGWATRSALGWRQPTYWEDPNWSAPDAPVTGISWWEASAYARWRGCLLPTEAQWEFAAKGPSARTYPWGDEPPDETLATFAPDCDPAVRRASSVFAHPGGASPFGCLDLAGNVAEWCIDNARPNYQPGNPLTDPVYWTDEADDHIVRGGSGLHDATYLRCTSRDFYTPGLRDNIVGVRLVRASGGGT